MVRKIYQVSLVGSESVATMVLLLTTLSGLMSFMVVFVRLKRQSGSAVEAVSWRNSANGRAGICADQLHADGGIVLDCRSTV